ncbi:hypothetical protein DH2020_017784 [Rehmannia glutinosa]|uniref:Myosin motor domain-containing protein n=1 Tax=Rehmannia glutinosa TaxID=99300 RepID=A0ABR0WVI8_REHGL
MVRELLGVLMRRPTCEGTPVNIIVGSHVWVEDPEIAWIDGQVENIKGNEVEVQTFDGKKVCDTAQYSLTFFFFFIFCAFIIKVVANLSKTYPKDEDAPVDGVTYTGSILIAINPFQRLPDLYDAHMMERYKGAPFGKLSPHVFAIADVAYRKWCGKTETTKMLMQYLAYLGGRKGAEGRTVEQQVLESNPVLEAFGNAKTVRNNNSSNLTFKQEIEKYKLGHPKTFHYLNQSNCYELVGVSDAHDYLATRKAMDVVGISQKEQDAIFRVVAAILHLGNVEFAKGEEIDSSVLKNDKSKFHLQTAAELLMCNPNALEDALLKRVMVTPEEVIKRSLDPDGALVSRDGLAKTLYSRLFDWLVDKINFSIGQDSNSKCLIGVLDIYGFESFETNRNCQLLHYEALRLFFPNTELYLVSLCVCVGVFFSRFWNFHLFFIMENPQPKHYLYAIAFDWTLQKPGGIIALLDEACMFPKSTHETFSEKLYQTFKSHKRFIKPKLARTDFAIAHYAGEVQYQSNQFLDKNKDYVVPEHQDLLTASKCPFVAALFPPLPEEMTKASNKSSKFSSIGSRFKLQLQQLMETLNSTEPHYIRCVKPNNIFKPAIFENAMSCTNSVVVIDEKDACKKILEKMGLAGAEIGKTKVFLRAGQMADLDARRTLQLSDAAKKIQTKIRSHIAHKDFVVMHNATLFMQSVCRGTIARKFYEYLRRESASLKIQTNVRGHLGRKSYIKLKYAVIVLQTGMRAMAALNKIRKQGKTATVIQAHWRGYRAFLYYKKTVKAIVVIQCGWRGMVARRELRKLKMAARETDALQEAKDKLEKKVEKLTLQLQIERRLRSFCLMLLILPILGILVSGRRGRCEGSGNNKVETVLRGHAKQSGETNALPLKDREADHISIEEASSISKETRVPVEDAEKIEALTSEVEKLKNLLQSEKQRADDLERQYAEALQSGEVKRQKLEETERRVHQLQESLNRMIYSMSGQFSELKMILCASSNSSSASGFIARDDLDDDTSASSDTTSTDSDFTFPAPASTPENFSSFNTGAFQLIVQDLSAAEVSGTENWEGDREGAFDDFF